MVRTPSYYEYYKSTYVIETDSEGDWIGHRLNTETGEFDLDNRPIPEILFATSTSEVASLDYDDFIWTTEEVRGNLRGDGAVFALYETINAIYEQAAREGRKSITSEELALIKSIRRRTFKMWEDEAARRAAGEPPTFTVRRP
ncbi:hypothetical protein F4560_003587 [Saccharothrix ecbatanensis]|uniref:Uncharacterized protein n=1 Tax=Saccharothrix ecbatanensis TaxID=1105145 RepID=A0A7W9M1C1_9PSEU|nr:hypothetical protein [Saccharothrix ecbatanensis]MBB5803819.1 hypothetical protein [Saccharothrix ecbatanensis]